MLPPCFNLVRLVMLEASGRQKVAVDGIRVLGALRWRMESRAGATLPKVVVIRDRAGRGEPRVRKRRPKSYPLMTRPRSELREELMKQGLEST